ncbi:hypothetical protein [Microbulbifer sp. S227A]|uniref:hypothetical protein n=1 Tax=Microbulbifer sp. S227A TaxID=3415131 RepID=UPI003C7DC541
MFKFRTLAFATSAMVSLLAAPAMAAGNTPGLAFAGALEFSDSGTLFVGDNYNGAIYAFDFETDAPAESAAPVGIPDIDTKIADLLGIGANALEINDMAVHPQTNEIYISVTRIGNFASRPAIVKVTQDSEIELLDLAQAEFTRQKLASFPESDTTFQARGLMGSPPSPRDLAKGETPLSSLAIMDMEYHNGELFVSGVAHDNFLSTLRRMSYPFDGSQGVTDVDMYHIAHDQYETRAPIRAMSVQVIDGKEQLVAAYTCSPLVLVPLEDIQDGAKISAHTIADMGNGQPVDMIPYQMNGQDYLFVTSNSRSPQVIPVSGLNDTPVVTDADFERGPKLDAGPVLPFGPVGEMVMFEGVSLQMDRLGEEFFVSLTRDAYTGSLNLDSNPTFFPNRVHNLVAEYDFPQWYTENGIDPEG